MELFRFGEGSSGWSGTEDVLGFGKSLSWAVHQSIGANFSFESINGRFVIIIHPTVMVRQLVNIVEQKRSQLRNAAFYPTNIGKILY